MKKILETIKQKWAEYLLEIIVIIIGILGAFSLNNWNDQRKLKAEGIYIISELQAEFRRNLDEMINVTAVVNSNVLYQLDSLLVMLPLMEFPGDEDKLSTYFNQNASFTIRTFNPSQGMINSLVNTSRFHLIKNVDLRRLLLNWSGYLKDYKEDESWLYNRRAELRIYLSKHLNQYSSSTIINQEGEPITNILELSNRLQQYRLHLYRLDLESGFIVDNIVEILKLLEKEE